ncbi:hypothetical protein PSY31_23115, partial [Shigella flexneri]|nr:hypothetical protein [Shigella flexneri]
MKISHDASSSKGTEVGEMRLDKLDEKAIRRVIARHLILDEVPFTQVGKQGFMEMVQLLEPRFKLHSRHTAMRDCVGIYLE